MLGIEPGKNAHRSPLNLARSVLVAYGFRESAVSLFGCRWEKSKIFNCHKVAKGELCNEENQIAESSGFEPGPVCSAVGDGFRSCTVHRSNPANAHQRLD